MESDPLFAGFRPVLTAMLYLAGKQKRHLGIRMFLRIRRETQKVHATPEKERQDRRRNQDRWDRRILYEGENFSHIDWIAG